MSQLGVEVLNKLVVLFNGLLPVDLYLFPEEVGPRVDILHLHLQFLDHGKTLQHESLGVLHCKLSILFQYFRRGLYLLQCLVLFLQLIVECVIHLRLLDTIQLGHLLHKRGGVAWLIVINRLLLI